jgi:uncharacterized membrane protein/thiol-disulfide isomerase/thioredoxin
MLKIALLLIALLAMCVLFIQPTLAGEEIPIVHAVLFYSPTCPHCHIVINEDIPPLIEQYGEQLLIIGINTGTEEGSKLYQAMAKYFQLPEIRLGVPALIVGETVMVGSQEIPDFFPDIISEGLQAGGIPWPAIPGLEELIAASAAHATAQVEENSSEQIALEITPTNQVVNDSTPTTPSISQSNATVKPTAFPIELHQIQPIALEDQSFTEKYMADPIGNSLAVIVLVGMILSVVAIGLHLHPTRFVWPHWAIPAFSAVGLVVAGYLSYIEVTHAEAVCGPVGDCNTVQQSPYALLFGILHIGVIGLLGYIAILIIWTIQYYGPQRWTKLSAQAIWGMAFFGTLFSIYLTFLEPFVIGATCAWCLASAILITAIFWAATPPLQESVFTTKSLQ